MKANLHWASSFGMSSVLWSYLPPEVNGVGEKILRRSKNRRSVWISPLLDSRMRMLDPVQFPNVWHQGKTTINIICLNKTLKITIFVFANIRFHKAIHLKTNQYNNNVPSLLLKIWPLIKGIVVWYGKMKTSLLLQLFNEFKIDLEIHVSFFRTFATNLSN